MHALAQAGVERFGGIDVWINNAGLSLWGPFAGISIEAQNRLVEVNLIGVMNGTHAALPHMLSRGGRGVIINMASIGGRLPMPFAAAYSASKFGVKGFTEALRYELAAESDIEVCGLYPSFVDTPTNIHSANYTGRALRPVPPVLSPERLAEAMVSLALRPRRALYVGMHHALAAPYALAPEATGRIMGRMACRFLLESGPPAQAFDGTLFEPVQEGVGIRGGWGLPERRRARNGALAALVGIAGASALLAGFWGSADTGTDSNAQGRGGSMTSRLLRGSILPRLARSLTIFAASVLMSPSAQAVPAFDHVVVFGDSLSDNGNAGRASNGPVWVEHLAARLGVALKPSRMGGSNFAVGGARLDPRSGSTSLRAQASAYLRAFRPRGRILHIVYGGGNDLLAAVGQPQAPAMVDAAVASLRSIVADLARQGATDILVPNLPAIGITPAVRAQGRQAVEAANKAAARFNSALDQALSDFTGHNGLRLYRLDVWQLAERLSADPAAAGFVDITTPCGQHRSCEGHLFWDDVHPTTQAHRRLAEAAAQVLAN